MYLPVRRTLAPPARSHPSSSRKSTRSTTFALHDVRPAAFAGQLALTNVKHCLRRYCRRRTPVDRLRRFHGGPRAARCTNARRTFVVGAYSTSSTWGSNEGALSLPTPRRMGALLGVGRGAPSELDVWLAFSCSELGGRWHALPFCLYLGSKMSV